MNPADSPSERASGLGLLGSPGLMVTGMIRPTRPPFRGTPSRLLLIPDPERPRPEAVDGHREVRSHSDTALILTY